MVNSSRQGDIIESEWQDGDLHIRQRVIVSEGTFFQSISGQDLGIVHDVDLK